VEENERVARTTRGVIQDPAPVAATFSYGDSAINYKRTTEDDRWPVRNELVTRLWYAARRHGLTIPYPIVTNINHYADEPFAKPVPPPVERLRQVKATAAVPAGVTDVKTVTFGRDEVIFDEGSELDGAYLVVSGAVSLHVLVRGQAREFAVVEPGGFFGEAGLYGCQPAEARAVAVSDTDVLWMSPETVRLMFEASPRLARDTGRALDVRRRALLSARQSAKGA
jgi:hypothetical protein